MSDELYIYVIYAGMPEYPGKFILRRDVVANGVAASEDRAYLADSLEDLREALPPGLHRLPRQPGDGEYVLETWL